MTDAVSGLHVIDLSNPANLRRVGGNGAFGAAGVTADSGGIYVTAEGSLIVLDSYHLLPELEPIVRVDDQAIGGGVPGPIAQRLQRELRAHIDATCAAVSA